MIEATAVEVDREGNHGQRNRWHRVPKRRRQAVPAAALKENAQRRQETAAKRGLERHAERERYFAILGSQMLSSSLRDQLLPSQALSGHKRRRAGPEVASHPHPPERTEAERAPTPTATAPKHLSQAPVQKRFRSRQHQTPAALAARIGSDPEPGTDTPPECSKANARTSVVVRCESGHPVSMPEPKDTQNRCEMPSHAHSDVMVDRTDATLNTLAGIAVCSPSSTLSIDTRLQTSCETTRLASNVSSSSSSSLMLAPSITDVDNGRTTAEQTSTGKLPLALVSLPNQGAYCQHLYQHRQEMLAPVHHEDDDGHAAVVPVAHGLPAAAYRRDSVAAPAPRSFYVTLERTADIQTRRASLPVFELEQEFMEMVRDRDVVIVVGPTGSGKTTQIPQFLYEAGYGHPDERRRPGGSVAIVQPRRLAAVWCAERVASELGTEILRQTREDETGGVRQPVQLGVQVGYHVRHDRKVHDEHTRLVFVTDGILLQQLAEDIALRHFGCVVLDEVHERSIQMDLLLGLLSRTVRLRRSPAWQSAYPNIGPLKLIIMSATVDAESLARHPRLFTSATSAMLAKLPSGSVPEMPRSPATRSEALRVSSCAISDVPSVSSEATLCCFAKASDAGVSSPDAEAHLLPAVAPQHAGSDALDTRHTQPASVAALQTLRAAAEADAAIAAGRSAGDKPEAGAASAPAVLVVPGRQYPVTIHFARQTHRDYIAAACEKCLKIHQRLPAGHILVFLPGRRAIAQLCASLRKACRGTCERPLHVKPLYAGISRVDQEALEHAVHGTERVCIVATNVAESAITIPNVRYVVDSGLVRRVMTHAYNSEGVSLHQVTWTSQASAQQRAGRAGRTAPGHCYRLYSVATFVNLFPATDTPEIQRMPLESVLLFLSRLGIRHPLRFPWVTTPGAAALRKAHWVLRVLGAVQDERASRHVTSPSVEERALAAPSAAPDDLSLEAPTPLGIAMARVPVSARLARLLFWVRDHSPDAIRYGIRLVALLSVREIMSSGSGSGSGTLPLANKDSSESASGGRYAFRRALYHPQSELLTKLRFLGAAEYAWRAEGGFRALTRFCALYGLQESIVREALLIVQQLERRADRFLGKQCLDDLAPNGTAETRPEGSETDGCKRPQDVRDLAAGCFCGSEPDPMIDDDDTETEADNDNDDGIPFQDPSVHVSKGQRRGFVCRWGDEPLRPPSPEQEQTLCRALLAAFPDQVARRMHTEEAKDWRQQHSGVRTNGVLFRCPVWETKDCESVEGVVARVSPCCPVDVSGDEVQYLLYTEVTLEELEPSPDPATKSPATVATLRGSTRIEPAWLTTLNHPCLVRYGDVVAEPAPKYDAEADQVMAWVRCLYGREAWTLPLCWMPLPAFTQDPLDGQIEDQRERRICIFARALLERQVLPRLPPPAIQHALQPSPAVLTWGLEHGERSTSGDRHCNLGYRRHRAAVLLVTALKRYDITSRQALFRQWRRDPFYLRYEFLLWVPAAHQGMIQQQWTTLTQQDAGCSV